MFDTPIVYTKFITDMQKKYLKEYAYMLFEKQYFQKNKLGANRFFLMVNKNPDLYNQEIKNLFFYIANFIGIKNPVVDPNLGVLISIIKPGGFIREHTDRYDITNIELRNKINVRFNIMIERDIDISYNPIINNQTYNVNEMDAWCFNASHMHHKTNKLTGDKNRLVYQFGFCV